MVEWMQGTVLSTSQAANIPFSMCGQQATLLSSPIT